MLCVKTCKQVLHILRQLLSSLPFGLRTGYSSFLNARRSVVYFDQHLGALHSKADQNLPYQHFSCKKKITDEIVFSGNKTDDQPLGAHSYKYFLLNFASMFILLSFWHETC